MILPKSASRLATFYNQLSNVFWSVLGFTPIGYFCYTRMEQGWIYIFLGLSLPAILLPHVFYDKLQIGRTTGVYEKIGIRIVRKFTQDGDWVNRMIRRRFPRYKVFDSFPSVRKHLRKAYIIEKVHFAFFLFFLYVTVYALSQKYFLWAVFITFTNLIFNIYPNLLQQYNRLRLRQLMQRGNPS
jgi:Glycosyl-4,4'-diaponeurosporenoate acyltransferase